MNKWIKFIDSCVGNIARKIQDEFDESKHPRDKGGKFTSKGGEGRGGGKEEKLVRTHKAGNITPERADALNEAAVALEEQGVPVQKILKMSNEGDLEGMQKLLKGGSESSSREGKASFGKVVFNGENADKSKVLNTLYKVVDTYHGDTNELGEENSKEEIEFGNHIKSFLKSALDSGYITEVEQSGDSTDYVIHTEDDNVYDAGNVAALVDELLEEGISPERMPERLNSKETKSAEKEEDDDDAGDPVAKMRKHLDDDLFELATRSESEEEFISKAERRIKQDLWAAKSAPEELPVKGQKAEYALKKILSEIKSGTSEYW